MDWMTLTTILGALGGLEFIKWLAGRQAYVRRENATARDAELTVHEKQIDRYEQRLAQRDAKVDAIYKDLREEQRKNLEYLERINRLELEKELLTLQKCEVRGCPTRKPPGDY